MQHVGLRMFPVSDGNDLHVRLHVYGVAFQIQSVSMNCLISAMRWVAVTSISGLASMTSFLHATVSPWIHAS